MRILAFTLAHRNGLLKVAATKAVSSFGKQLYETLK